MWNLLSNAFKFTPREGRVRVEARRADACLEVSVSDSGQGIAPEFLPFVFDRFRQADSSTTRRAGGLGLSIAKQLVELHGGTARELVKKVLEDCRAEVRVAASSDEALGYLRRERFDVLVSDIAMPEKDGHELIRELRGFAVEQNGEIPAMALTAYARPEDRVRALRAGFRMHTAKPIDPAEFVAIVASLARR